MTKDVSTSTVAGADGTPLALHSVGEGPDLVVVHGAMQTGISQRDLALLLADSFRVHLLDRRGRGASGGSPADATTAVSDLRTVVAATGARRVLGISSGALVAARAALADAGIERLALFEPPMSIDGSVDIGAAADVIVAVGEGRLERAAAIGMKAAEMGPAWMFGLPLPLLTLASRGMLRDPARRAMASALPEDFALVRAEAGRVSDYALLHCRTLLIDGTATRPYLRKAVAALAATIPGAEHVELPGQWHSVTQNRDEYGRPDTVAPALIRFFAE